MLPMTKILSLISFLSLVILLAYTTRNAEIYSEERDNLFKTLLREPISLRINDFNYTDVAIDSFSVNSSWGGNILVSTPTSGGG